VIVATCQHEHTKKNGVTKSGAIRIRCKDCGKSWTESTATLNGMRIGLDQAAKVVEMLVEGMVTVYRRRDYFFELLLRPGLWCVSFSS
jgi:transposase-like protein